MMSQFNSAKDRESSYEIPSGGSLGLMALGAKGLRAWREKRDGLISSSKITGIAQEEEIVIVSGLPRSGTSMLMQMLQQGGLEVLSDTRREADENNPKGYLEFDPVKKLHLDSSWISDAKGKVLKVIARQLVHLPAGHRYRIIFMHRELNEVLVSQQKMLGKESTATDATLHTVFERQRNEAVQWADKQPFVDLLELHYAQVIQDPVGTARAISSFLERTVNEEEMVKTVDKNLYRNRN